MIKNIIYNLFFKKYDDEIDSLKVINQLKIDELNNIINDLNIELIASKNQLKELLNDNKVNVNDYKDWYEFRFGNSSWFYNYDGNGSKDVKTAFRYKKENGKEIIRDLSNKIIDKYKLVNPTLNNIIESVKKYFILRSNWTYVSDLQEYGVPEYWAEVDVSATSRRGDCDSLALLMHMLILDIFEVFNLQHNYWRLKLAASTVLGEGGHAYNLWLHDDGEWYVIESTYDLQNSFRRTWLKTPVRNNNLYVNFWGFARPDRSFKGYNVASLQAKN